MHERTRISAPLTLRMSPAQRSSLYDLRSFAHRTYSVRAPRINRSIISMLSRSPEKHTAASAMRQMLWVLSLSAVLPRRIGTSRTVDAFSPSTSVNATHSANYPARGLSTSCFRELAQYHRLSAQSGLVFKAEGAYVWANVRVRGAEVVLEYDV